MFTEAVLRHAPWSFSKVGALNKCTRQYRRSYVLKIKGGDSGPEAKIGVLTHRMLEHSLKSDELTTDALFEEAVAIEKITSVEADTAYQHLAAVDAFIQFARGFLRKHGTSEVLIEHKLAITPEFKACPFFFRGGLIRGVLDWGVRTRSNDLIIIDHKTGKPKPIDEYAQQLHIYRLLGRLNFPVRSVQCAIHHLVTKKIEWTEPWTMERIDQEVRPWLALYLNKQSRRLQVIDEAAEVAPEVGWQCGYCGHIDACAEGKRFLEEREQRKKRQDLNV